MVGQVKPKKVFHGMFPDLKALSVLFKELYTKRSKSQILHSPWAIIAK
jgi:hypothetical protein